MSVSSQKGDTTGVEESPALRGESVVISGMSGIFPESHHVKEFSEVLYNKVNGVTGNPRWIYKHPEVSQYVGKVPALESFDAQFFRVNFHLASDYDPAGRKVLEHAFQAIYDAGVNPEHLHGKTIGVFVGLSFSDKERSLTLTDTKLHNFLGCSRALFANRISYWLNVRGPSVAVDMSCCSSIAALETGYEAIIQGRCEAAIIASASLNVHPHTLVHYRRVMPFCVDGKVKSFDQNADGIIKSEAISVLFLQRARDAKRIYAEVLSVKTQFTEIAKGETGPRYGFYRSPHVTSNFLKQFYEDAGVPPQAVEYVEAFGSAVPDADKAELEAIEEVFCQDRDQPLLVGSITSNIGNCDAASGLTAITKLLLGYHRGELAANLHCENPRRDIAALREGRMRIVTDHQRFARMRTAVNGLSINGINSHVLLQGHYKPKDPKAYKSNIPHLVTISGRQESAVQKIFDDLKSRPIDPEEIALFHNIHQTNIPNHLARGYTILDTNEDQKTVSLAETVTYFDDGKRPLWFVYSGMGSQWSGMGADLMRIPVFAAAIERCHKVLKLKGLDIVHIITSPDETIFDNILNSFVGIAAIQIGLTDVLKSMGIEPDKMIGHSVGELGCAYADGCMSTEEMILASCSRGDVSINTPLIHGSMAAVGLGFKDVSKLIPPEIEVACHNSPHSSTISGPSDVVREFIDKLTAQGIFAKEVKCSNIAYHSRYIAETGPKLLKRLKEVIPVPKPRSNRWVSTSVPQDRWHEPSAMYSSAEYHTNNLLGSVLFEEASRLIPLNAVLVEIAPHSLLQAILKRSLPETCTYIPLMSRTHNDKTLFVLEAIGKLYIEGFNPKLQALYPKVEFPVSTETPFLSHLVEWNHQDCWSVPAYSTSKTTTAACCKFLVTLHDDEHSYLQGHVIKGKTEYPFSAALVAAWDTLAMYMCVPRKRFSVQFHDVHLYAQPVMHDQRQLNLSVTLQKGCGRFEIMVDSSKVIDGFIASKFSDASGFNLPFDSDEEMTSTSEDLYQLLNDRDHSYRGDFCSIHKANKSLTEAQIVWNNNWVTFLDGILQLNTLRHRHNGVSKPHIIRRICIDVDIHMYGRAVVDEKTVMVANVLELYNSTRCGGVLIEDVKFKNLPVQDEDVVALQTLRFVPRFETNIDITSALQVYIQLVSENIYKEPINVLKIISSEGDSVFDDFKIISENISTVKMQYKQLDRDTVLLTKDSSLEDVDLVLLQGLSSDDVLYRTLYHILRRDIHIINAEATTDSNHGTARYQVLSSLGNHPLKLELLRWKQTEPLAVMSCSTVTVLNNHDLDLLVATRKNNTCKHKLTIISTYPPVPGLKDLVNEWRKESGSLVCLAMVSDIYKLDHIPKLDLAFNVFDKGVWGGEFYTPWQDKMPLEGLVTLRSARIGDLESLLWVQIPEPIAPGIAVTVHFAAINYIDVMRATGAIPLQYVSGHETSFGMDVSGVTVNGERVMGLLSSGAVSGRVKLQPELTWPVPEHWSLEDATTVPSAYALAYYCLVIKSGNRCYDRTVLVDGGAGALGQAVISVALAHGYEVFTTVSDIRKKRFLLRLFPQLQDDHVGNSRDNSFVSTIMSATKGQGCYKVISWKQGDLKDEILKCCGVHGILLDVGLVPNQENYKFGMKHLYFKNYIVIDLNSIIINQNVAELKLIQELIGDGISRGHVRPLTRVTYAPDDAPRAFRLLAAGQHRGRVLLQLGGSRPLTEPRLTCSSDSVHLLICDDLIFGTQLADRLVERGARKLVLHTNNVSNYVRMKISSWEKSGVKVDVSSEDISSQKNISAFLTKTSYVGPVEGIYVITNRIPDAKLITKLENLDSETRKSCPLLRNFAILSIGNRIGHEIYCARKRDGLPATILTLPPLRIVNSDRNLDESESLPCCAAVDVTERALCCSRSMMLARHKKPPHRTVLQKIFDIADIAVTKDVGDHATLQELGITAEKASAISSILCDVHNISWDKEKIPLMTVKELHVFEEILSGFKYKEVQGLETFFSSVNSDELLATTEMIVLPTLANTIQTMICQEFDVSQTYLCIIPGLEGTGERFRLLCQRLKLPSLVLQPGLDHLHESLRDTARRYAMILLKKLEVKKKFYLLGYECGVLVALETASILEEHGLVGTVYCMGGPPEVFQATLEEQLRNFDSEQTLQDGVVRHMITLMSHDTEGLDKALLRTQSWKEKVDTCVRMLAGKVVFSTQYARALIEAAYASIRQAWCHKVEIEPLQSRLILLQASSMSRVGSREGAHVALLQRYSQQPVTVYELRAPLAHAMQDLRCAAIINNHLDDDIKNAFEQRNLCDTYPIGQESFH